MVALSDALHDGAEPFPHLRVLPREARRHALRREAQQPPSQPTSDPPDLLAHVVLRSRAQAMALPAERPISRHHHLASPRTPAACIFLPGPSVRIGRDPP